MEPNDRFFNAYVDLAVGELHKNINTILELKTQIKLLEDANREKDAVISKLDSVIGVLNDEKKSGQSDVDRLYQEKEQLRVEFSNEMEIIRKENDALKEKMKSVEEKYEIIQQKSTHMSTYEQQIKDMKKEILAKTEEIDRLKNPVKKMTEINSKSISNNKKPLPKVETIVDDF